MPKRPTRSPGISVRVTPTDQRDFIELARKRFKQSETADTEQRRRELDDLQFYAGEQWDPLVKQAREGNPANQNSNNQGLPPVPPRPAYVVNKVREPVRQVLNQERQADLGVEIVAADDFGEGTPGITPQEIELREGLVRRIQRESQAADARSWAFQRAVIAGRGYYRVMTRYAPGKTNDQEIYVERIYNQASVSLDPSHQQPDGSDAEWGFIGSDVPWDRYVAEYGEVEGKTNALTATSTSEWRQLGDELPGWFSQDGDLRSVRIVEYWYTTREPRSLIQLTTGAVVYEDEAPEDAEIAHNEDGNPVEPRTVIDKRIKWAKMDGVQVLDETDWDGKYLPLIKVVGEELQPFDSQRRAEGMVRPARDSQKGFNVMVSKWVEQIGLAPIPPWMGPAGFDEGFENEYLLSTTRTIPALHFNTVGLDGQPIPPPNRTSITMEIQAIAGSVQLFDQAIKSTTAMPDPTNLDPKINSDRQLRRVLSQSTAATSHYMDNLTRSIRYEGLIINDLLYPVMGRKGRLVRGLNKQGESQLHLLDVPFVRHPKTKQPIPAMSLPAGQPVADISHVQLTPDATFNVTVKVTKNAETQRDAIEETLTSFVQADPQYALPLYGDLIWKYYDGPGREELEERGKLGLAPQVQAALKAKETGQAQQDPQLQQLQQENMQLKQLIQSKQAEKQAEGQIELQKAQMDNDTKIKVAQINQEGAFAVADLKATLEAANTAIAAMQAERLAMEESSKENRSQAQDHAHAAHLQQAEQAHEIGMAAVGHAQALQQGAQANAAALQQGDQAHQQQLEQGVQAAALQPPPATEPSPPGAGT